MNKTRSHLHMFLKNKLIHHCFKSPPFICTSWINYVNFLHFWPGKIHVSPTSVVSSRFPSRVLPLLQPTSSHRHAVSRFLPVEPRWARYLRFIFREWFIPSPSLSSWNQSFEFASSLQATLPDRLIFTLCCYKKIFLTLVTVPITQSHLYFASSLARAPRHQRSTCRRCSLSLLSHAHWPSAQWHL
jgi:hypothetical protein